MEGPRRIPKDLVRRHLADPETFATTVHVLLLDVCGVQIYEADPVEVYLEIRDYTGQWMPVELENKWNAMLTCLETDRFFSKLDVFRAVCTTLLDGEPDLDSDEDPTFTEIAWALHEVEFNREDNLPFDQLADPAIVELVDRVLNEEGIDIDDPEFINDPTDPVNADIVNLAQRLERQLQELGINPVTKNYADVTSP